MDEDQLEELAAAMDVPVDQVALAVGHGWHRAGRLWFVAGAPAQVMVRADRESLEVASARVEWAGHRPELVPHAAVTRARAGDLEADMAWLAVQVDKAAARRRQGFRFCRFCRSVCAPEELVTRHPVVCHGCGSRYLGIVF